jgi:hypothetical protein
MFGTSGLVMDVSSDSGARRGVCRVSVTAGDAEGQISWKGYLFDLPAAPVSATVGSEQYRMSVVFELEPCGRLEHFEVPKDARISVCGSRLRRR